MEKRISELMDRFDEGNMSVNDLEKDLLELYRATLGVIESKELEINQLREKIEQLEADIEMIGAGF